VVQEGRSSERCPGEDVDGESQVSVGAHLAAALGAFDQPVDTGVRLGCGELVNRPVVGLLKVSDEIAGVRKSDRLGLAEIASKTNAPLLGYRRYRVGLLIRACGHRFHGEPDVAEVEQKLASGGQDRIVDGRVSVPTSLRRQLGNRRVESRTDLACCCPSCAHSAPAGRPERQRSRVFRAFFSRLLG